MLKKILLIIASIFCYHLSLADCMFTINNTTNLNITAQYGFYTGTLGNGIESALIKPNTNFQKIIKSAQYNCTSSSSIGTGIAYISFPKDKNGAGVNYNPTTKQLVALGLNASPDGAKLASDNGTTIWIYVYAKSVDEKNFSITLRIASFPNSFSASTL